MTRGKPLEMLSPPKFPLPPHKRYAKIPKYKMLCI